MNILPLVFTFLIILSCIAFTFLREVKSIFLSESSLNGFHKTERMINNKIVQKAYRKAKGEPFNKNESEGQSNKKDTYSSKRLSSPPLDCTKLNLTPMIEYQGELKAHPLYETFAQLLRIMYEGRLFAKNSGTEYLIVEALIKKAKGLTEVKNLSDLYPDNPALSELFYKMLKGTNQYSRDQGIYPLSDFLAINQDHKAAYASFASPLLLEALFGDEITHEILDMEQKKWAESGKYYYCTQEDLQKLLMKSPARASTFTALQPLLNFSKQPSKRHTIGQRDKRTGIAIEKELH